MMNKDPKNNKTDFSKEDDNALWAEVTKDITPLPDKNTAIPEGNPQQSQKKRAPSYDTNKLHHKQSPAIPHPNSDIGHKELDHRTRERLRRGQVDIEGRIDLHGMSQNQAYDALLRFIPSAHAHGKRCLLIVTGKGHQRHGDTSLLNRTPGVLRQKTPQWLSDPPLAKYVLDVQNAKPKDGGEGALYVLLRRRRDA